MSDFEQLQVSVEGQLIQSELIRPLGATMLLVARNTMQEEYGDSVLGDPSDIRLTVDWENMPYFHLETWHETAGDRPGRLQVAATTLRGGTDKRGGQYIVDGSNHIYAIDKLVAGTLQNLQFTALVGRILPRPRPQTPPFSPN